MTRIQILNLLLSNLRNFDKLADLSVILNEGTTQYLPYNFEQEVG